MAFNHIKEIYEKLAALERRVFPEADIFCGVESRSLKSSQNEGFRIGNNIVALQTSLLNGSDKDEGVYRNNLQFRLVLTFFGENAQSIQNLATFLSAIKSSRAAEILREGKALSLLDIAGTSSINHTPPFNAETVSIELAFACIFETRLDWGEEGFVKDVDLGELES